MVASSPSGTSSVRNSGVRLLLIVALVAVSSIPAGAAIGAPLQAGMSVQLVPRAVQFDADEVARGAVGFTAVIRNEGGTTVTVAHPSICVPADYQAGQSWHMDDAHGNSEILLKITRPDGARTILRQGYLGFFDPDNVPFIEIRPASTGEFDVAWFFQNARGRWERDDEAARVFRLPGSYKVRLLMRNLFPLAVHYDPGTRTTRLIDVWTGEIESPEISIEVR